MRMMTRRDNRGNRRTAASVVEFAVVAPVLLLFLFGLLEYSRLMFTIQMLNNAAREGARYAVVNVGTVTTANVQDYVNNYLVGQGTQQLTGFNKTTSITVYQADSTTGLNNGQPWQNSPWGKAIGVSITGTYKPFVPGLIKLTGSLTLTGTCVMTTEVN
jgi:Flp pilus assembly protein TadG